MSRLISELLSFSKASIDQSKVTLEPTSITEVVANAVRREQVEGSAIEQRAYQLYEHGVHGNANADWIQAQSEIIRSNFMRG